jgi:hypothetical protein
MPFHFGYWPAPVSGFSGNQFRPVPCEPSLQALDETTDDFHGVSWVPRQGVIVGNALLVSRPQWLFWVRVRFSLAPHCNNCCDALQPVAEVYHVCNRAFAGAGLY